MRSKCKKVEHGTSQSINVTFKTDTATGFAENGYKFFDVIETDKKLTIGEVKYYNHNDEIFLPLAHKYPQTTYVFSGDSVQPETLIVDRYNSRIIFDKTCKYSFEIDTPHVQKCTFKKFELGNFSTYNQNLTIDLSN